jgi:hypothetical protein
MAVRRESLRLNDSTALIQIVTFVHVHVGTRATLLDVTLHFRVATVADTAADVLCRAQGLMSLADSREWASRQTAPIADVLALGHCLTIAVDCLGSLCLALARHLQTMIALTYKTWVLL